jgi:2-phosphosulfolactate phosphatase
MRVCLEDLIGAGAIVARLSGNRSPEARVAEQAFESVAQSLEASLLACPSGRELAARGFAEDVRIAATIDDAATAPELRDHAFVGVDETGAAQPR